MRSTISSTEWALIEAIWGDRDGVVVVPLEVRLLAGRGNGVDWEIAAEESPWGCENSGSLVEDCESSYSSGSSSMRGMVTEESTVSFVLVKGYRVVSLHST